MTGTAAFAPFGSLCAAHPAVGANIICARCGAFMCPECSGGGREAQCPKCRGLGAFDAQRLARAYRSLVLWFGAQLVLSLGSSGIGNVAVRGVVGLLTLVTIGAIVVYAYRTAEALGSNVAVLWAVAMFVPCVNIITLLVLSSKATAACRQRNIPVGFLGPKI